jgi:type I restriction enzyme S subunit
MPPIREQMEICKAIWQRTNVLDRSLDRAQREIDLLREYRARLIVDLVTGKLDVRDAVSVLPAGTEEHELALKPDAEDETEELLEALEDHE